MISRRIEANLKETSPMFAYMGRALANAYHPADNPEGIISLGIAENTVMSNELSDFLSAKMKITPKVLGYAASSPGPPELRAGLVRLYNSSAFNPAIPVEEEHLYFTSGCTTLLDQCFWTLCDEGEGVLIGRPSYGGFASDMTARGKLKPIHVSLKGVNPFSVNAVYYYEQELLRAEQRGIKVRMLILCQPHNPLGQCYSRKTIISFMHLCQKYQIHLLSDEIYALTTFVSKDIPDPVPFTSLLSINKTGIINPGLCHVIHGMSKDFCSNGIRGSVLISQGNPLFLKAIRTIALFSWPSSLAGLAFTTMLNHPTFLSEFVKTNRARLRDRYEICTRFLSAHEIPYLPANAGFFVWADLSQYLSQENGATPVARERALNDRLFNGGIHLATSEAFFGEEAGWFRISFAVDREVLQLGLTRMSGILNQKDITMEIDADHSLNTAQLFERMIDQLTASRSRRASIISEESSDKTPQAPPITYGKRKRKFWFLPWMINDDDAEFKAFAINDDKPKFKVAPQKPIIKMESKPLAINDHTLKHRPTRYPSSRDTESDYKPTLKITPQKPSSSNAESRSFADNSHKSKVNFISQKANGRVAEYNSFAIDDQKPRVRIVRQNSGTNDTESKRFASNDYGFKPKLIPKNVSKPTSNSFAIDDHKPKLKTVPQKSNPNHTESNSFTANDPKFKLMLVPQNSNENDAEFDFFTAGDQKLQLKIVPYNANSNDEEFEFFTVDDHKLKLKIIPQKSSSDDMELEYFRGDDNNPKPKFVRQNSRRNDTKFKSPAVDNNKPKSKIVPQMSSDDDMEFKYFTDDDDDHKFEFIRQNSRNDAKSKFSTVEAHKSKPKIIPHTFDIDEMEFKSFPDNDLKSKVNFGRIFQIQKRFVATRQVS